MPRHRRLSWRDRINRWTDQLGEFLAYRKGLLPMIGLLLIGLDGLISVLGLLLGWQGGLFAAHCFLGLGAFLAILGFLLAWAL
ncbi:MAG: hypothetical protein GXO36_00635 [Chloroflexi bacterium]|nr:hypothetical protein [Chloroflexota bacterium]